jgi:hypothetical protein
MKEAGVEIPKELVLEGSVGEIVEDEWDYALALVDVIGSCDCPAIEILREDVEKITNILDVDGWESYVIVTSDTPLERRIHHMDGARKSMMKYPAQMAYSKTFDAYAHRIMDSLSTDTLLIPFYRNIWLKYKYADGMKLLCMMDWEAVDSSLDRPEWGELGNTTTYPYHHIRDITSFFLLRSTIIPNLDLFRDTKEIFSSSDLAYLYYRVLDALTEDTEPNVIGLGSITFGDRSSICVKGNPYTATSLRTLVSRVNSRTIYNFYGKTSNQTRSAWNDFCMEIHYEELIASLAKGLGLYALRRMMLSLSHSVNVVNLGVKKFILVTETYLSTHTDGVERVKVMSI